ncbi:MAG: hypothetical protein GY795_49345 [Desulfobacterales bacterium]|nr:hypothetical protein [Desulfobacterales bacterium]
MYNLIKELSFKKKRAKSCNYGCEKKAPEDAKYDDFLQQIGKKIAF